MVGAHIAVPTPSSWAIRSCDVSLLEPNRTSQSTVVVADEPAVIDPKSVEPAVIDVHAVMPIAVALGTVAPTTVPLVAASVGRALVATSTARPPASSMLARVRARDVLRLRATRSHRQIVKDP